MGVLLQTLKLLVLLSFLLEFSNGEKVLRFRQDGTFKIAQFADLHYGEGEDVEWGPEQDRNSTRVMRSVLKAEDPDFVIFSGDQITGNNILSNATAYWKELLQPCIEGNYRWSIVFGNHDDLASGLNGTRKDLLEFDMTFPLSFSQAGPSNIHGLSNYYLPIYSYSPDSEKISEDEEPVSFVFFLDSGGGTYLDEIVYPDQVEWYRQLSTKLQKKYGKKPSVAFFHIPTAEYLNIYSASSCFGTEDDGVTPQEQNNGLFQAFADMGDVKACFVGHDHGNDFCCPTSTGVHLCFGRHTGYGGYGDWDRGSRILLLNENPWTLNSWVRMEDGRVIDSGSLN